MEPKNIMWGVLTTLNIGALKITMTRLIMMVHIGGGAPNSTWKGNFIEFE